MANTNRTKGHDAERLYANEFKKLGYDKCVTSRYGSRMHDDAGVDLINLPINAQIKAGYDRGINYSSVLRNMHDRLRELFPASSKEFEYPSIVIHRKDVGRGKKRGEYDDLVIMSWLDYKKLIDEKK